MNIIGHQKIINLLNKAIAKGAVNQSYLFCGPEKVGKFTVAKEFAEKIISCSSEITPDLIIVRPETEEKKGVIKKHDIKIEAIRDLQHQLSLTTNSAGYKVAIIDEAERLNKTAQNALLKTLEEANERVVLILVASDERKLLPTILSRCQKIKFGIVSDAKLSENIPGDTKDKKEIIFWSLGRPGLMLDFLNNAEIFSSRKEIETRVNKIFSQNVPEKFALAEEMSKDVVSATEELNLWTVVLRKNILENINSSKALKLLDMIEKSLALLRDTNSNARLVLENLLLQF
jgi:DNA polymerase III subunit delta'